MPNRRKSSRSAETWASCGVKRTPRLQSRRCSLASGCGPHRFPYTDEVNPAGWFHLGHLGIFLPLSALRHRKQQLGTQGAPAGWGMKTPGVASQAGTAGRFVFVPGSRPDEVDGRVLVEAVGPPGVLRTVHFAAGETGEGLDVAVPMVLEGELLAIRHPARGEFPAVVELQVR